MKLLTLTYLFVISSLAVVQAQNVTGVVTDVDSGDPLIGVSVFVENTARGTITDYDGSYSLEASEGEVLAFSYVGYKGTTITIGTDKTINVQMTTNSELIDEVVVIGYGTVKKSDLTGSVSSVKSEDIVAVPTNNAMQALQGKVSGLQILSTSGDPGAAPVVRLRGITTLNNNNPIAVIDGVITDIGAVSLLNPNDIESIEVLKDASATAIYGSRGAAGVVIVTTKRGAEGQKRINVSIERGVESVANKIDVMDGREFATYLNGINPGTYNNLDALPNTDWQDLIFQSNAAITNANFSVSGGSATHNYYFGLGYFGQEGVLPKSGLDRLSAKINSGFELSKFVNIGLDMAVSVSDKENAPGVVNTALRAWPVDEPFLDDGVTFAEVQGGNPVAAIEYANSTTNRLNALGNLYANFNLTNNLTFKSSVQFDVGESKSRSFTPEFFVGPLQQNERNNLNYSTANTTNLIFENTLSYNKDFGDHGLNAVVGYTTQDLRNEFLSGSTEGLLREDPLFWYLDAGQTDFERVGNNLNRQTLISYLARANYTYDSRYLFTASFRRDGSSNFGPANKYGNFYSLAAGWNISNEDFWNQEGPINSMKLRASFGSIGNERIPGTAQYALIVGGQDAVLGEGEDIYPGATFSGGGNPRLKWEETKQFNVGVDFGIWDDRLIAEIDYYQKNTSDILVPLEPIGYTGVGSFRSIFFNAADVRNSGFEWNVSYRNNIGDFSYQVGVLGSTISNEVTNIGQGFGADSLLIGGDLGNGQQVARTAVGFPIGFFYGYETDGVFQTQDEVENSPTLFGQGPGDLRFKDIDGDGRITTADRTQIGNSIPSLVYGFNFQLGYKNFSVNADFQGQQGNQIYNGKQAIRFTTLNYEDRFNDYWTRPNSTNENPRPSEGGVNFLPSDYFLEDGSFLRLRTLTLNYKMPNTLLRKLSLNDMSVYVRGTNLFTATAFSGYSPEIGAGSALDGVIDRGIYPITRVFTVGLNTNF